MNNTDTKFYYTDMSINSLPFWFLLSDVILVIIAYLVILKIRIKLVFILFYCFLLFRLAFAISVLYSDVNNFPGTNLMFWLNKAVMYRVLSKYVSVGMMADYYVSKVRAQLIDKWSLKFFLEVIGGGLSVICMLISAGFLIMSICSIMIPALFVYIEFLSLFSIPAIFLWKHARTVEKRKVIIDDNSIDLSIDPFGPVFKHSLDEYINIRTAYMSKFLVAIGFFWMLLILELISSWMLALYRHYGYFYGINKSFSFDTIVQIYNSFSTAQFLALF